MSSGKVVAVAGATGAVGLEMIKMLEQRDFPVSRLIPLASERSAGKFVSFKGKPVEVQVLKDNSFKGVDFALFSAGSAISKEFAEYVVKSGAVMIDNSSAFRMQSDVPLVVPEVNPQDAKKHKGIIANPNCSTVQMVVALKPLHDAAKVKRVIVTTFQAVSGAGSRAIEAMYEETKAILNHKTYDNKMFPHQIAFNCIPQIPQSNAFEPNGYTSEEMKMFHETKKIMGDDSIMVSATTVRVPVERGHSEAVYVELAKKLTADEARKLLAKFPGIEVVDDPAKQKYPLAVNCMGKYPVYVGRIRENLTHPTALDMWIVSDNLLKGAALNAVQIAEILVK